ncbi:MAG: chalcone isomerase family protein [Betaproteobacteria bacterium]|nr:chalcone isomerase family protein [Betaproteobacteria bacterium]MDE2048720.1 chalcone isomerase family protein [Betaproteobacteria bacterium]
MTRLHRLLLPALCLALWLPAAAWADWPTAPVAGLQPAGQGRLTWFGLHIYDARLYVQQQPFDPQKLDTSHFALALRYARSLVGAKIAERTDSEMAAQGRASTAERAQWLADMRRIFPDVKAGDTLSGVYAPGEGTRFYRNDVYIGRIDGARFADCFFGIWLAADTSEPSLRAALLKGADVAAQR